MNASCESERPERHGCFPPGTLTRSTWIHIFLLIFLPLECLITTSQPFVPIKRKTSAVETSRAKGCISNFEMRKFSLPFHVVSMKGIPTKNVIPWGGESLGPSFYFLQRIHQYFDLFHSIQRQVSLKIHYTSIADWTTGHACQCSEWLRAIRHSGNRQEDPWRECEWEWQRQSAPAWWEESS